MANKHLMTIDDYSKLRRYKALNSLYKKLSLVLFVLLLWQLATPVEAAECLRYSGTGTNATGEYDVLYRDGDSLDGCSLTVAMSGAEYAELKTKADMTDLHVIDPLDIAESFTWGFATYLTFWWLSFVIKSARMTIKRL
jgi:hypothetical protein